MPRGLDLSILVFFESKTESQTEMSIHNSLAEWRDQSEVVKVLDSRRERIRRPFCTQLSVDTVVGGFSLFSAGP